MAEKPIRNDPYEYSKSTYTSITELQKKKDEEVKYREWFKTQLVYYNEEKGKKEKEEDKNSREKTSLERDKGRLIDILYNTGQEKAGDQLKYQVEIEFEGTIKDVYDDVLYFGIVRVGFIKSAPLYTLNVNIKPTLLNSLRVQRDHGEDILLKLSIWTMDMMQHPPRRKRMVLQKPFKVVSFHSRTDENIEKTSTVMVTMILASAILREMSQKYTYNKILNNVTVYDVLLDYESHIDQTYGSSYFKSKHILNQKNEFKYEQLSIRPTDVQVLLPNRTGWTWKFAYDIDVPMFLQNKYKIDNSFGFYFFDEVIKIKLNKNENIF